GQLRFHVQTLEPLGFLVRILVLEVRQEQRLEQLQAQGTRLPMSTRDTIRAALVSAARSLGAPDDVNPVLERPKDPVHGEWATNLAMTLARPLRRKPAEIARDLV